MNVKISLNLNKDFKAYALDTKGTKDEQIEAYLEGNTITFSTDGSNSPYFLLQY